MVFITSYKAFIVGLTASHFQNFLPRVRRRCSSVMWMTSSDHPSAVGKDKADCSSHLYPCSMSAILRISYDGSHFHGFSAANDCKLGVMYFTDFYLFFLSCCMKKLLFPHIMTCLI